MQPIWGVIVVAAAFFLILHLRNRKRRAPPPKVYARRVDGVQMAAYLHPQVSRGCLGDHGLQFGKGFRRKQGPPLPHDENCQCRAEPFSYTSSEVFNGALREPQPPPTSIERLPGDDAVALLEALRAADAHLLPADAEEYVRAAGTQEISDAFRGQVEAFFQERYAYLKERETSRARSS